EQAPPTFWVSVLVQPTLPAQTLWSEPPQTPPSARRHEPWSQVPWLAPHAAAANGQIPPARQTLFTQQPAPQPPLPQHGWPAEPQAVQTPATTTFPAK